MKIIRGLVRVFLSLTAHDAFAAREIIPNAQQETHFSPEEPGLRTVTADLMSASESAAGCARKVKLAIARTTAGAWARRVNTRRECVQDKTRGVRTASGRVASRDDKKYL